MLRCTRPYMLIITSADKQTKSILRKRIKNISGYAEFPFAGLAIQIQHQTAPVKVLNAARSRKVIMPCIISCIKTFTLFDDKRIVTCSAVTIPCHNIPDYFIRA